MTKNTQDTKKIYKAFGGKILFDYKKNRDDCIKFMNQFRWRSAEEPIPFVDWKKMVNAVNSMDVETEKQMKELVQKYYNDLNRLNEQLYAEIDKFTGLDKIMARFV